MALSWAALLIYLNAYDSKRKESYFSKEAIS